MSDAPRPSMTDAPDTVIRDRIERCLRINSGILCRRTFKFPESKRYELASRCFDLSIEHHSSVSILASSQKFGSANALLRCIAESTVAGLWTTYCASNDWISQFEEGNADFKLDRMLKALSSNQEVKEVGKAMSTLLSSAHRSVFSKMLDGFTHGSAIQLTRRLPSVYGTPGFTIKEIRSTLMISDMLMTPASAGLSVIDEAPELHSFAREIADSCAQEAHEFFGAPPPSNFTLEPLTPPRHSKKHG